MNKKASSVEKYDERCLYPMLLRFYHHLHLVVEFESEFVEQIVYANYNLDIFEMVDEQVNHQKRLSKESS
jgi:hypothetical protein